MQDPVLYFVAHLAVVFGVLALILGIKTLWLRKKASAVTFGTITDTDCKVEYDLDRHRQETRLWIIRYTVDGSEITLRQQANFMKPQTMKQHIGESVTVHYDPDKPQRAWAETPDRLS